MPALGPTKRQDLIRGLRQSGCDGPYSGGKHQFMKRDHLKLPIANPHQADISVPLLKRILAKAGITEDEWERLWPAIRQQAHDWLAAGFTILAESEGYHHLIAHGGE
jgi:hypothetical protein